MYKKIHITILQGITYPASIFFGIYSVKQTDNITGVVLMSKKQKKKKVNNIKIQDIAQTLREPNNTDISGSYTGTSRDGGKPVQDADDL